MTNQFACFRHKVGLEGMRELLVHLRLLHDTPVYVEPPKQRRRPGRIGRPRTARCGTQSGYARHLLDSTLPCRPCVEAHRVYQKQCRERRVSA